MPERRSRFRKTWILVLVILVPLLYLLGAGPWGYLEPHLPHWAQASVGLVYFPLPWLVYESGFADTRIGNWYTHYLFWWATLREEG